MLCEECHENEASVVVTTVMNGVTTTRHLCRECVKKYQAGDIQGVLAAILASMAQKTETPKITCPRCGMTYAEFKKSGRLGCPACYQAFKAQLQPVLTRIHGRAQHAGRRPPVSEEEQARIAMMEDIKKRMEDAVAREDFEQAAVLRDELRAVTAQKDKTVEKKEEKIDG